MFFFLLACTEPAPDDCAWPDSATDAGGVLENTDTCGFWSLEVDGHLYVNVGLTEPDVECSAAMGEEVSLNASPIYSNLTTDGPKWTFDVVGVAPTAPFASLDVPCDEGTRWAARVEVQAG